jgi:hypothetical protein
VITDEMAEVLAFDQYETIVTRTSVRTRRRGTADDTIDDVEFTMPCAAKVWVPTPVGGHPVRSIQYEMALDQDTTYCVFFLGRKTDSDEDRVMTRELLDAFVWETFTQVFREDSWITNNQGAIFTSASPTRACSRPTRVRCESAR